MNFPERPQIARHAESLLLAALADTRIVALVGPRQSGKTTLAKQVAAQRGMRFITLDDEQSRQFANDDPTGFVRGIEMAVIDEVQRAPALLLALKQTVDENPTPGRFLVTGSVDLFKTAAAPDSLAGRVETITLLPLSQSELEGLPPSSFIDRAFERDFRELGETERTTRLIVRVLLGGFPEVQTRSNAVRRRAWFRAYASSLAERDVSAIASVDKANEFSRLIEFSAAAAGQLVNMSALATRLHVDQKTVGRWLQLLEQLFLLTRLSAWHGNTLKRMVKSPKLHFVDSGLMAAIQNTSAIDLEKDRTKLGPLLECFVYAEIAKLSAISDDPITLTHYRDGDKKEVDLVLERAPGRLVGIEVKASATVKPSDLQGLKRLESLAAGNFECGIVLYDGDQVQRVGERMFLLPIHVLWT